MPCLKWMPPVGPPRVYPIYKNIISVGAAGGNDVSIEGAGLSDYHAQIIFDGKDFNLNEVDRHGAILVNGKKKRRCRLVHHDRLTFGEAELTFSLFDEMPAVERDGAMELGGLRKLYEFSQRLMELKDVQEMVSALLDAVIEVTSADKGFLVILEDGRPRVAVARNVNQENDHTAAHHLSDSILRRVMESRKPLIISDALHDDQFSGSHSVMSLKLSSVMCAPLIAQGELLGVLYLGNDNVVNLFEEGSLDVLNVFAGQAALILQNAMLLDNLQTGFDALKQKLDSSRFGDIIGSCPSMIEKSEAKRS